MGSDRPYLSGVVYLCLRPSTDGRKVQVVAHRMNKPKFDTMVPGVWVKVDIDAPPEIFEPYLVGLTLLEEEKASVITILPRHPGHDMRQP